MRHGAKALARHVGPQAAGFNDIDVNAKPEPLRLPLPADFFWQYIHSTSLAEPVSKASADQRTALEE